MVARAFGLVLVATVAAGLAGCATSAVSHYDRFGNMTGLVWPPTEHAYLKGGTFADPALVESIGTGATVGQVRAALGPPQFNEGHDAREWDYQLKFYDADKHAAILTCRYKIVFDSRRHDRTVSAVYWGSDDCIKLMHES